MTIFTNKDFVHIMKISILNRLIFIAVTINLNHFYNPATPHPSVMFFHAIQSNIHLKPEFQPH